MGKSPVCEADELTTLFHNAESMKLYSSFFSPLNLNSLISVNLCSSKVENGRTSLILFIQELIESFLMLLSIYVGWDSDCRVLTCLDMRAGINKDTETTSLGFSVAKNGSFKSSVAGNLIDAGTRHCSMNCLTWGSLTLPREAGFMPCNKRK